MNSYLLSRACFSDDPGDDGLVAQRLRPPPLRHRSARLKPRPFKSTFEISFNHFAYANTLPLRLSFASAVLRLGATTPPRNRSVIASANSRVSSDVRRAPPNSSCVK